MPRVNCIIWCIGAAAFPSPTADPIFSSKGKYIFTKLQLWYSEEGKKNVISNRGNGHYVSNRSSRCLK